MAKALEVKVSPPVAYMVQHYNKTFETFGLDLSVEGNAGVVKKAAAAGENQERVAVKKVPACFVNKDGGNESSSEYYYCPPLQPTVESLIEDIIQGSWKCHR